ESLTSPGVLVDRAHRFRRCNWFEQPSNSRQSNTIEKEAYPSAASSDRPQHPIPFLSSHGPSAPNQSGLSTRQWANKLDDGNGFCVPASADCLGSL
ncbi:hypothetical protein BaRGS_00005074, partial [Batillaria attramentaria]